MRSLNPEVSPALEKVVWKCLEKEPQRRYPSAMRLLEAVEMAINAPELTEDEAEITLIENPATEVITQTDLENTSPERRAIRKPGLTSKVTGYIPRSRKSWALTASAGLLLMLNWFSGQIPKA
jgi:hypothetical protein